MGKKIRIEFKASPNLAEKCSDVANRLGISRASLVSLAVCQFLEAESKTVVIGGQQILGQLRSSLELALASVPLDQQRMALREAYPHISLEIGKTPGEILLTSLEQSIFDVHLGRLPQEEIQRLIERLMKAKFILQSERFQEPLALLA